jgi:hypothetical protein
MKFPYHLIWPLATGLSLHAQDTSPRFGFEFFLTVPTGILSQTFTGTLGQGVALNVDHDIFTKQQIRFTGGYSQFLGRSLHGAPPTKGSRANLSQFSASINYLYFINPKRIGPYVFAGLGDRIFQGDAPLPDGSHPAGSSDNPVLGEERYSLGTGHKLAYAAGVGYAFGDNWGLALRYQASRSKGHTLGTLEAALSYRY